MVSGDGVPSFPVRRTLKFQAPIDKRIGEGQYERAVNRLQTRLVRAYDAWARVTRGEMKRAIQRGLPVSYLNGLTDARVDLLLAELSGLVTAGVGAAGVLSVGRAGARSPLVKAALNKRIGREIGYLQTSLGPDIKNKIRTERATSPTLNPVLDTFRSRVASYAGGAWAGIFEAQKVLALKSESVTGQPQRVRWVLDEQAVHCKASGGRFGCPDLAGEYSSWNELKAVPAGEVTCAGNCRCHLEVFEDGAWQRGL